MIDIDYFKMYNDCCGHLAGDDCLRFVARGLKGAMGRAADFIGRYGGEEFLAILPETDESGALVVATHIQRDIAALEIPHPTSSLGGIITLSIGIATAMIKREKNYECLLKAADNALYQAKQEGRNRIVCTQTLSC